MNKLTAVLLDDESQNNEALRLKLELVCSEVEVIEMLTDPLKAIQFLNQSPPIDILFLDVEMPELNGFQVLDSLHARNEEVIMVTAYAEYALQAIKAEAIDYLLKPVEYDELRKAINKVHARKESLHKLAWKQRTTVSSNQKILLHSANEAHYIGLNEIISIKGENNYSEFQLISGKKILISKTLKDFEDQLSEHRNFFRVHKSSIINLEHVKRLIKSDTLSIELSNLDKVDVSLRKRNAFLQILDEGGWTSN